MISSKPKSWWKIEKDPSEIDRYRSELAKLPCVLSYKISGSCLPGI